VGAGCHEDGGDKGRAVPDTPLKFVEVPAPICADCLHFQNASGPSPLSRHIGGKNPEPSAYGYCGAGTTAMERAYLRGIDAPCAYDPPRHQKRGKK
jgi:hypothetical protein